MNEISHAQAFEVLCLQAASDGRREALFGESLQRACAAAQPFMIGEKFPSVYLEFPLIGAPFLDVTVLYRKLEAGQRVQSEAVAGSDELFAWFAQACGGYENINFGFELDTKYEELPRAAVHFQPRTHIELVEPFFEAAGEPERAALYLDLVERMPEGWPLSFCGMFRGRPGSPLRVCGYLATEQQIACSKSRSSIAEAFERIGFNAYDDAMLSQISELMALTPGDIDFQFDVFPDGTLGTTFAIDMQFQIEQPKAVCASFEAGAAAQIMARLQELGSADDRWRLAAGAAFARAIPVHDDRGTSKLFAFSLMPQWAKARWIDGKIQPSKLYYLGSAGLLDDSVKDRFARRLGTRQSSRRRGN